MLNGFSSKDPSLPIASFTLDDALVHGLTVEHQTLLELYQEIHKAVTARKFSAVERYATKMHDQLHNHLNTENMQLYTKLKRHLEATESEHRQMVHDLQRQMFSIGVAAVNFIRQARMTPLTNANADRFRSDLEGVGAVLVNRIRQEEDVLYPLYLNTFG